MPVVRRGDLSIYWAERGEPDDVRPPVVLLHGLLLSTRLFERLAVGLRDRWVLLVDLHGHGKSSKPTDPARYSWTELAADVEAVLDALDVDEAVVGGLSLGANVTLTFAAHYPERCAGLIVEMPALSKSFPTARPVFGALERSLRFGRPVLAPIGRLARRTPLPRQPVELAIARDVASLEPAAASALIRGILAAPPDISGLADVDAPTLVIGHRHDPIHVLGDAEHVAKLMPNAELHVVRSMLHYRLRPTAQAGLVHEFLRRNGI